MSRSRILILSSLLQAFLLTPLNGRSAPQIEEGKLFPNLVLPDLESGQPTSIQDFHGRKIVLHIFASW